MPYQKRCSTKAMQENVRLFIREGKGQRQAVAIAYSVLKKACRCLMKRRMTPKQIVACGKRKRAGVAARHRRRR